MSRAEAKEYLARLLDEMDAGLRGVMDEAAASGGPTAEEWDRTPASLAPVWEWAVPRLSWRAGYEPPALGMPGPRIAADQLEPADQLPSWFHHPSAASYAEFSAGTLWLIDGLGRYLGETVLATVPGTSWAAGHSRTKGYMFQNQPVISGLAEEESPSTPWGSWWPGRCAPSRSGGSPRCAPCTTSGPASCLLRPGGVPSGRQVLRRCRDGESRIRRSATGRGPRDVP
jgi:hypothetical protein